MDGWMDEWMDGWVRGWMGGRMERPLYDCVLKSYVTWLNTTMTVTVMFSSMMCLIKVATPEVVWYVFQIPDSVSHVRCHAANVLCPVLLCCIWDNMLLRIRDCTVVPHIACTRHTGVPFSHVRRDRCTSLVARIGSRLAKGVSVSASAHPDPVLNLAHSAWPCLITSVLAYMCLCGWVCMLYVTRNVKLLQSFLLHAGC